MSIDRDAGFMQLALAQARLAQAEGEVPVGAVVVQAERVIGVGRNAPIGMHDPTAHAEIQALRQAAQALGNYRLDDCELYVTLEPCAMCSGAMLHARIARVVWGAADPKTGANGSVIDVFMDRRLNHHTQVLGGVLEAECGELLAGFFKDRRAQSRQSAQPLRDDALRTPESRFESLPTHGARSVFINDLPALSGLRMHCIDDGPREADRTWLCLHGAASWSHAFRYMIPALLAAGDRVVAPDLIGFGRSDKPKREEAHRFEWHREVLLQLIEHLDLRHVIVVTQDRALGMGVSLVQALPERFDGLMSLPVGKPVDSSIDDAPFPDRGHRAALRARPFDPPPGDEQLALDRLVDDVRRGRSQLPSLVLTDTPEQCTEPGADTAAVAMRHFPRG